jgi:hypothetical protein
MSFSGGIAEQEETQSFDLSLSYLQSSEIFLGRPIDIIASCAEIIWGLGKGMVFDYAVIEASATSIMDLHSPHSYSLREST